MQRPRTPINDETSELSPEELLLKQLQEDTTQSAKSSLQTLVQTKQMAAEILEELDSQREQEERINADLDTIEQQKRVAERHTRSIASVFGRIANWFSKEPAEPAPTYFPKSEKSSTTARVQATLVKSPIEATADRARDKSNDEMLDEMFLHLQDLKVMAGDMSTAIDDDLQRLDVLIPKTEKANASLKKLNADVRHITPK